MELLQTQLGLAFLGFFLVALFTAMVLSNRIPVLAALILTPVLFALVGGFGAETGEFAIAGILKIAPVVAMITFAILYFSLMLDAGLFDPLVSRVVAFTADDPMRVTLGTAVLALVIAFSGDGTSTALVLIAAFLPVYHRLRMDPAVLGAITAFAIAVQNLSPWGGPTPRLAAALGVDPAKIFVTVLPSVTAGIIAVLFVAWIFGKRETRRLADPTAPKFGGDQQNKGIKQDESARRPRMNLWNLLLTLALIAAMAIHIMSPAILFPIACAVALTINYPDVKSQSERIAVHANNIASLVLLFFGAGIFSGILNGTGMIAAMAAVSVGAIPAGLGGALAPITAIASMPMTYFMPLDAFYFGAVPVISQTASAFGITPAQTAAASLMGLPVHVLSPLLPSLYVFSAILGIEPGRYLRLALPWGVLVSAIMIVAALLFGVFPLTA